MVQPWGARRYTEDLPPGVLERNNALLAQPVPPGVQTAEQIEACVHAARQTQPTAGKPAWAE